MERILEVLRKNFPGDVKEENGRYTACHGAFSKLTVWVDNKKLYVETESDKDVTDEVVLDTNKRYRTFLQDATGYTAKERLKKAKKDVGG